MSCRVCFCFRQKTAYEMRISDWSSDVCSSDLASGPQHSSGCRDQRAVGVEAIGTAVERGRRIVAGDFRRETGALGAGDVGRIAHDHVTGAAQPGEALGPGVTKESRPLGQCPAGGVVVRLLAETGQASGGDKEWLIVGISWGVGYQKTK